MRKKSNQPSPLENRHFTNEEITSAIVKLNRRITEVEALDPNKIRFNDAQVDLAESNIRNTVMEIFGENSPEYREHGYITIWEGGYAINEPDYILQKKFSDGLPRTLTILRGLISRLEEKSEDLGGAAQQMSLSDFWSDIHPKITAVAMPRYDSEHYADAVEAALKEINSIVKDIVKRKTGNELDGASLMRTALTPNSPIICLDDLSTETGRNIQQGYMEIFAGAMTGIRNPKAHGNIKITENRARHFIYLASLLMHKIDERI